MLPTSSLIRRRALLGGIAALAALPAAADAPVRSPLPPARPTASLGSAGGLRGAASRALTDVIAAARLGGQTAVLAVDAETGAVIEETRAAQAMPPASTAKALTALYGMQTLGHEHRFVTRILARGGSIQNGVLAGDLILRGGGDPTLQTEHLARMADQLIRMGLREVTGRLLVDDTALPQLPHIFADQPVSAGYNPGLSGTNLNFNRVNFVWDVAGGRATLSMDARSEREIPPVRSIAITAAARDLPVYTHSLRDGQERWTVAASALRQSGSRWLPVRQPAIYAGDVLRALLAARGWRVPAPQRGGGGNDGQILAESRSEPLASVVRDMLRFSTNITAECVGLSASLRAGRGVSALDASARAMSAWVAARYGAQGLSLVDHSGLNDRSTVTAQGMVDYLRAAQREGVLPGLLRDHAMRDSQGRTIPNHPVSVQAKTGTLNFVSSLVGYAQPRGGRPLVFAIISADLAARRALADENEENPSGTRAWTGRARALQQTLIERWAVLNS